MSLVLLNVLAVTRLLPVHAPLMEAAAILFLFRVTLSMRDGAFASGGRHSDLTGPEGLSAAPTYARAKIR